MKSPVFPLFLFPLLILFRVAHTTLLIGCTVHENLCEKNEICVSDGLFGECSDGLVPVLTYFNDLDPIEIELLNDQLLQLKTSGNDWKSSKTQCVLIYFKLAVIFQLKYDEDFCEVHNPANIWQLLQIVKSSFSSKDFQRVGDYIENSAEKLPDNELLESYVEEVASEEPQTANDDPQEIIENTEGNQASPSTTDDIDRISDYMNDDNVDEEMSRSIDVPEINNDEQLKQFIKKFLMRTEDANSVGEEEEMVPLNVNDDEEPPLKKDIEHLGNPNIGLENTEHKIVKGSGPFQKVEANRVYLKISDDLNDEQFYRLIQYLNQIIAKPKNLIFSDFAINDDQLSFEVSRSFSGHPRSLKRLDAIADVAEAVYKRRKDIESLSGVHVDETGIGSGQDSVPLENNNRDDLFIPILTICALTILVLITVMAVHQFRQMQRNRNATQISKLAEQIESKTSSTYQELCRNRMTSDCSISNGNDLKNSGKMLWCEEPLSDCNMDISTGHVILSFLQEYLQTPSKIEEQWATLRNYTNQNSSTSIAEQENNRNKNRDQKYLPYNETLVHLNAPTSDPMVSTYINASTIHDSDPRQANYIATQAPLPNTIDDFWQMIWEQGAVLIVNLTDANDNNEGRCVRYWPENGSHVYGSYEIHLVSEHIWSEDYLVRSFYLKNLKTNETRTVTQFHFLTWPQNEVPLSFKAILDFRRKVNKSYHGRAAPLIVHCTNGSGRTGAYCLLDIVLNRISKGIKELNIAGSLEFLRDQRVGMVESDKQYKMVFSCLAEEVTTMVKTLRQ